MIAIASIATPETDAALRRRENENGRAAKTQGLPRDTCPWLGGLCEAWWLEGYDGIGITNADTM